MERKSKVESMVEKILIIGNKGYIGPILARQLSNYYLIGLDNNYFSNCSTDLIHDSDRLFQQQINKDVRNIEEKDLYDIDHVVYLAAISNDPMGNMFKNPTFEINSLILEKIAKYCSKQEVKSFTFASSCSVYGASDVNEICDENSKLNPVSNYAVSKINGENILKKYSDNFKITCLRFATACGFSPRLRLDLVLNDFCYNAITNKLIKILSNGKPWRPLIHVSDMARAINWSIERTNGSQFLAINVGSNSWNFQISKLAEEVSGQLNDVEVQINHNAEPDKRSYRVDFTKYENLVLNDYKIKISLSEAVNDLITNINHGLSSGVSFSEPNTVRLKKLNLLIDSKLIDNQLNWKL